MSLFDDKTPKPQISATFQRASTGKLTAARAKRKTVPPFSLRFTPQERDRLDREAGNMALGAYIRAKLFDGLPARRSAGKNPVKDYQALAKILGELGQSRIANNLNQVAKAINTGTVVVSPEMEAVVFEACDLVNSIRRDLISALGLENAGPT
jgi:hypothetical protein